MFLRVKRAIIEEEDEDDVHPEKELKVEEKRKVVVEKKEDDKIEEIVETQDTEDEDSPNDDEFDEELEISGDEQEFQFDESSEYKSKLKEFEKEVKRIHNFGVDFIKPFKKRKREAIINKSYTAKELEDQKQQFIDQLKEVKQQIQMQSEYTLCINNFKCNNPSKLRKNNQKIESFKQIRGKFSNFSDIETENFSQIFEKSDCLVELMTEERKATNLRILSLLKSKKTNKAKSQEQIKAGKQYIRFLERLTTRIGRILKGFLKKLKTFSNDCLDGIKERLKLENSNPKKVENNEKIAEISSKKRKFDEIEDKNPENEQKVSKKPRKS